jgi:hypothetical protein
MCGSRVSKRMRADSLCGQWQLCRYFPLIPVYHCVNAQGVVIGSALSALVVCGHSGQRRSLLPYRGSGIDGRIDGLIICVYLGVHGRWCLTADIAR